MFDPTELLVVLRDQARRRTQRQEVTLPTLSLMISAAIEQALRSAGEDLDAVSEVLGTPRCAVRVIDPAVAVASSFVKHASAATLSASRRTVSILDWAVTTCEK